MKNSVSKIALIALPLVAAFTLGSCNSSGYHAQGRGASTSGYVTYASLPRNYSGNAYYYNNRYYAGGRYETGRYSHSGRRYTTRYYHNGQYLYGGEYRQHGPSIAQQQPRSRRASSSTSYVTYTTLPRNYAGDAYYYNNRYYAGGRYETGRYSYGGRTYTTRYVHNGQYLYGGDYRQHTGPGSVQRRSTVTTRNRYPTTTRTVRASY